MDGWGAGVQRAKTDQLVCDLGEGGAGMRNDDDGRTIGDGGCGIARGKANTSRLRARGVTRFLDEDQIGSRCGGGRRKRACLPCGIARRDCGAEKGRNAGGREGLWNLVEPEIDHSPAFAL